MRYDDPIGEAITDLMDDVHDREPRLSAADHEPAAGDPDHEASPYDNAPEVYITDDEDDVGHAGDAAEPDDPAGVLELRRGHGAGPVSARRPAASRWKHVLVGERAGGRDDESPSGVADEAISQRVGGVEDADQRVVLVKAGIRRASKSHQCVGPRTEARLRHSARVVGRRHGGVWAGVLVGWKREAFRARVSFGSTVAGRAEAVF